MLSTRPVSFKFSLFSFLSRNTLSQKHARCRYIVHMGRDQLWLLQHLHRGTFNFFASLMHQVLHQRCPTYLSDLVEFNSVGTQRRLRSTTTRAAVIRRTRTQFGRRAFTSLFVVQTFGTLFPQLSVPQTLTLLSSVR